MCTYGQLNKETQYVLVLLVPIHAREFGLEKRFRQFCTASACSFSILMLNLVLTYSILVR